MAKKTPLFYNRLSETEFEEKMHHRALFKNTLYLAVLCAASVLLSFFMRFRIPFLPKMFEIDFSVLPELIAALAYGPIFGVIVCLIKNVIHTAVMNEYLIIDVSNFVVESVFVVVAGVCYFRTMFPKKIDPHKKPVRFFRGKTIVKSTLIASAFTLPVKFLDTLFFVYPMLEKYFSDSVSEEKIISNYNVSIDAVCGYLPEKIAALIPNVKTVWQGILMVNLPVTFGKLMAVTLLTLLLYPLVSPFLHGRYFED